MNSFAFGCQLKREVPVENDENSSITKLVVNYSNYDFTSVTMPGFPLYGKSKTAAISLFPDQARFFRHMKT